MDYNENGQIYRFIENREKNPDQICGEIFQKTDVLPTQCYLVNDGKDVFIKFPSDVVIDHWTTTENIKILKEMGLTPKLSSNQIDMNTIYINSAPREIFNLEPEELIKKINEDNPNIYVTSLFVPPPKYNTQNLGSLKLTLPSRLMVNSILYFGLKLLERRVMPEDIQQGNYLTIEQCSFCQGFHKRSSCHKTRPTCPHCGGHHQRFECKNRNKTPWCSNCSLNHKATSNLCEMRKAHMTRDPIDDMNHLILRHPYRTDLNLNRKGTPKETMIQAPAPTTNPWTRNENPDPITRTEGQNGTLNVLNNMTPLTTYYDCLRMSLLFEDWYGSFLMLQPLLGLPKWEMPLLLRQNMKGPKEMHPRNVREEAQ